MGHVCHGDNANESDHGWRIERRDPATGERLWEQVTNVSPLDDDALDVAAYGTGVYAVGFDGMVGGRRWRVEKRRTSDGALEWVQTLEQFDTMEYAEGVAADETGVYVVGEGIFPDGTGRGWRVEKRRHEDGELLWVQVTWPFWSAGWARAVTVNDSWLYVAGSMLASFRTEWWVERRSLSDGALSWSRWLNPSDWDDDALGVAVDASGLYVVGDSRVPEAPYGRWHVEKWDP